MTEGIARHRSSRPVGGLSILWAGFLAGVSMLATPVKFTAPSLELPVALDVGRVTFAALNRIEIGAMVVLLLVVILRGRTIWNVAGAVAMAALVATQTVWLLPALDARVGIIMGGGTPPESGLHLLYVAAEAVKIVLLLALRTINLWRAR